MSPPTTTDEASPPRGDEVKTWAHPLMRRVGDNGRTILFGGLVLAIERGEIVIPECGVRNHFSQIVAREVTIGRAVWPFSAISRWVELDYGAISLTSDKVLAKVKEERR